MGCRVVLWDVNEKALENCGKELREVAATAAANSSSSSSSESKREEMVFTYACDVSDYKSVYAGTAYAVNSS